MQLFWLAFVDMVPKIAAERFGILEGTPVYLGCSDFLPDSLAWACCPPAQCLIFRGAASIWGLSPVTDSFVSGSYFENFAVYGGTKSSGTSINYTIRKDLEGAIAALSKPLPTTEQAQIIYPLMQLLFCIRGYRYV